MSAWSVLLYCVLCTLFFRITYFNLPIKDLKPFLSSRGTWNRLLKNSSLRLVHMVSVIAHTGLHNYVHNYFIFLIGVHSFGVLSQKCTDSSISQTTKNPADHPVVVLTPETNSCEDESMNISSVLHSSGPVRREKVQSSPLQRPPRREVHFSATDTSTSDSSYSTGPGTRHARVSPSRTRFVSRDSVPTHTKEQKHISTSPKQKQRSLSSDILPPSSSSPSRIQTSPLSKPRVANSPVTRSVMTEITNKRPKLPLASDKSVQTQSHPYSPPDLATHLSQPELSVSDTASSLSEKLLSKAARNRPVAKKSQLVQNHHSRPSHASKPPKPPVAKGRYISIFNDCRR